MATPAPVQHVVWSTNSNAEASGGNAFKFTLPNATLANNCLVLELYYPNTATISSITDDSNTWSTTPTVTVNDTTNNIIVSVFVLLNAAAGAKTITVTFSAVQFGIKADFSEWYNIATASATDGSAAVFNQNAGTVASGSFNTTTDGDLILHFGHDTGNGQTGLAGNTDGLTKITKATGYTLLQADLTNGYFLEYQVQGTHGATNPSASVTTTTNGGYSSLTLALKSASAGTAPTATPRVFGIAHNHLIGTGAAGNQTQKWQFPTQGSTFAVLCSDPKNAIEIVSISGSVSGSWTTYAPDPGCPTSAYKVSGSASGDEMLTLTINDHITHQYIQGCAYDMIGLTSFDTSAFSTSSASFGPGNTPTLPSITPGVSSGIVLSCMELNTGPPNSLVTPTGGVFVSTFYTNETDLSPMDNGDCHGFIVYSSNATQNWVYHDTAASVGANGIALSFAVLTGFPVAWWV